MDKDIPLENTPLFDKRVTYTLSRLECGLPVDNAEFQRWAHATYDLILTHYAECEPCMVDEAITPSTLYDDTVREMLKLMTPGNRLIMSEKGYEAATYKFI